MKRLSERPEKCGDVWEDLNRWYREFQARETSSAKVLWQELVWWVQGSGQRLVWLQLRIDKEYNKGKTRETHILQGLWSLWRPRTSLVPSQKVKKALSCSVLEKEREGPRCGWSPWSQASDLASRVSSQLLGLPRLSFVSILPLPLAVFPETPQAGCWGPQGGRGCSMTELWDTRGRARAQDVFSRPGKCFSVF